MRAAAASRHLANRAISVRALPTALPMSVKAPASWSGATVGGSLSAARARRYDRVHRIGWGSASASLRV
jgi:hypothetical protein